MEKFTVDLLQENIVSLCFGGGGIDSQCTELRGIDCVLTLIHQID